MSFYLVASKSQSRTFSTGPVLCDASALHIGEMQVCSGKMDPRAGAGVLMLSLFPTLVACWRSPSLGRNLQSISAASLRTLHVGLAPTAKRQRLTGR